jgi:hypothetical protein
MKPAHQVRTRKMIGVDREVITWNHLPLFFPEKRIEGKLTKLNGTVFQIKIAAAPRKPPSRCQGTVVIGYKESIRVKSLSTFRMRWKSFFSKRG